MVLSLAPKVVPPGQVSGLQCICWVRVTLGYLPISNRLGRALPLIASVDSHITRGIGYFVYPRVTIILALCGPTARWTQFTAERNGGYGCRCMVVTAACAYVGKWGISVEMLH